LVADAVSLTAIGFGFSLNSDNGNLALRLGIAKYGIATPRIHVGPQNPGRAIGSFGMRIATGLLAGIY
jgi:hypothetical protein